MNSSENWDLKIDPGVLKTLQKIPRRDAETILRIIRLLTLNPFFGDIQKMKGADDIWRRRVGSYRIFYKLIFSDKIILVSRLERRTSKTY